MYKCIQKESIKRGQLKNFSNFKEVRKPTRQEIIQVSKCEWDLGKGKEDKKCTFAKLKFRGFISLRLEENQVA